SMTCCGCYRPRGEGGGSLSRPLLPYATLRSRALARMDLRTYFVDAGSFSHAPSRRCPHAMRSPSCKPEACIGYCRPSFVVPMAPPLASMRVTIPSKRSSERLLSVLPPARARPETSRPTATANPQVLANVWRMRLSSCARVYDRSGVGGAHPVPCLAYLAN